mgnify:CR=1 FL=1
MAPKTDGHNASKDVLIFGLGEHTGGEVWIEDPEGKVAPPVLENSSLSGQVHDIYHRFMRLDTQKLHGVFPVVGRRFPGVVFIEMKQ